MILNIDYLLKNKGGIYIGSTNNFTKRYNDHRKKLSVKKHANKYLQSFYNKYGSDSLLFQVLCICKNSCLLYSEQYFISLLTPEFNIKKIIERKHFDDEIIYDYNRNKKIVINFINTMIDDITDN